MPKMRNFRECRPVLITPLPSSCSKRSAPNWTRSFANKRDSETKWSNFVSCCFCSFFWHLPYLTTCFGTGAVDTSVISMTTALVIQYLQLHRHHLNSGLWRKETKRLLIEKYIFVYDFLKNVCLVQNHVSLCDVSFLDFSSLTIPHSLLMRDHWFCKYHNPPNDTTVHSANLPANYRRISCGVWSKRCHSLRFCGYAEFFFPLLSVWRGTVLFQFFACGSKRCVPPRVRIIPGRKLTTVAVRSLE